MGIMTRPLALAQAFLARPASPPFSYTHPETCLPAFPKDAAPFLDATHDWRASAHNPARS
jgi:hypothetical protein